jgi:hypothetical protein
LQSNNEDARLEVSITQQVLEIEDQQNVCQDDNVGIEEQPKANSTTRYGYIIEYLFI